MEKLLFEYRAQKKYKKLQEKSYDYKVKRREKIIKNMEVVGKKIELVKLTKTFEGFSYCMKLIEYTRC